MDSTLNDLREAEREGDGDGTGEFELGVMGKRYLRFF